MIAFHNYKDSNLDWCPDIPEHWLTVKLGFLCSMASGDGITSEDIEPVGEYPVFGGNGIRGYYSRYNQSGEFILIGRQGSLCGNINVAKGKFWASEHAVVVSHRNDIDFYWLKYLLEIMNLRQYSAAAALPGLAVSKILSLKVPLPPFEERVQIANFINNKTKKLDRLIIEKEAFINLLQEKRQALISHVVTKGLDDNVKMKPSGIDWIGDIPEHWTVSSFRYITKILTDYTANGSFADLKANVEYKDEPSYARLVRLTDLRKNLENSNGVWIDKHSYEYLSKSALFGGEFLLANVGAYAGLFYQMPHDKGYASLAPNMFMARFDEKVVSEEFMAIAGQSDSVHKQLRLLATSSAAQPKLNKDDFKSIRFAYPSLEEQSLIAEKVRIESEKYDSLLSEVEKSLVLLKEHRTALISAAVTGKIDVREAV